jgi:hypothetical protein
MSDDASDRVLAPYDRPRRSVTARCGAFAGIVWSRGLGSLAAVVVVAWAALIVMSIASYPCAGTWNS